MKWRRWFFEENDENPQVILQQPTYPSRITVWSAFCASGLSGPFFFENTAGDAVIVNGIRYHELINNFFWSHIVEMYLTKKWFQQDHTLKEIMRTKFEVRIISRWKRCDVAITIMRSDAVRFLSLDFFLRKLFANNPRTIPELKDETRGGIDEIKSTVCENVVESREKCHGEAIYQILCSST